MIRTCTKCGEDHGVYTCEHGMDKHVLCRCERRFTFLMVVGCCLGIVLTAWVFGKIQPLPKKESSYNHQRVTEQQIPAIAKEAKSRGWKYIRTEDGR